MKNKTKDSIMAVCFCASLIGFGGSVVAFSLSDWILGIILLVSFSIFFTIFAILLEIEDCEKESNKKIDDIKPEDLPKVLKTLDMETNIFDDIIKAPDLKSYARIEDLRLRDELRSSNFTGKLKNEKLIQEFKNEIRGSACLLAEKQNINLFDYVCEQIDDYNFKDLEFLINKLREYEAKQKILDEYKEEALCKKNAETSKNSKR